MNTVYQEEYKGGHIEIYYDEYAESPREWDNMSHMLCISDKYRIGDKGLTYDKDCETWEKIEAWLRKEYDIAIIEDIYIYDHSCCVLQRGRTCPWDSSRVGFQYMTKDDVRNAYGIKYVTKAVLEQARKVFDAEFREYADYISGNVYGYKIVYRGEEDSCAGIIGDYDDEYGCLGEARIAIDALEREWGKHKGRVLTIRTAIDNTPVELKYHSRDFYYYELVSISGRTNKLEITNGIKTDKGVVAYKINKQEILNLSKEMEEVRCQDADGKKIELNDV